MTDYAGWIDMKADALQIREELGDPRLRAIAFEYQIFEGQPYLFIIPRCVVTKPPIKMMGIPMENNLQVEASDYYVKSVPRSFPREAFKTRCWLDAVLSVGGEMSGVSARVHWIDDSKGLSYNLILRQEIEQKNFS